MPILPPTHRHDRRQLIGFSKKWENHEAMMSLDFGVYNFCMDHGTLKTTPAVAAGLTDHVWSVRELLTKAGDYVV